jgi:HEXXH motif-containing protein
MISSEHQDGKGIGSCSGHNVRRPFTIYVTHFDGFGTAESMLHEMAHIKLRCLGVQVENCSRLIVNHPSELYASPLRSFKRPMTAVVHAFYSWLHLTELDVRLAQYDHARACLRLRRNCEWIDQMLHEIRSNVRLDGEGEAFFMPLYAWADRLLGQGRSLIESNSTSKV